MNGRTSRSVKWFQAPAASVRERCRGLSDVPSGQQAPSQERRAMAARRWLPPSATNAVFRTFHFTTRWTADDPNESSQPTRCSRRIPRLPKQKTWCNTLSDGLDMRWLVVSTAVHLNWRNGVWRGPSTGAPTRHAEPLEHFMNARM